MTRLLKIRGLLVYREPGSHLFVVRSARGRAGKLRLRPGGGVFGNGSRWWSGWHEWPDPADLEWEP